MQHPVYICEDYQIKGSILIMWNPVEVGRVDSIEAFNELTELVTYNAIICPELFDFPLKGYVCKYHQ